PRVTTVIFDLGDVLFMWSSFSPKSPLSPRTLKQILRSSTWFEYEKGNLTEKEAYSTVAREINISAGDVATAFKEARKSLRSDPTMLDLIRELKAAGRTVFAMSNISAPDRDVLVTKADPSEWAPFDQVFISAKAHERKLNVGFYQHVLKATDVDPTRTVFVDDKLENVLTARSFGLHGIVFNDANKVARQLRNLV
ncbi:HAD-like protein, partial [Gautieria morchelliformis]